ncbi:MAG TPA: Clp1/GlmU family protein [Candidatus Binatia bacterium]|nr:Clp1/GlmU family protein [Candidatus Binatia bacterium]
MEKPAHDFRSLLQILTDQGGTFFVLGRTDVGKSTFLHNLVRLITARGKPVAVIDADLGQSTYGLPTTLNLVRFSPEVEPPAPECVASIFIGATSPVGHLLSTLVGCRRLLDRARQLHTHSILVDTTGLVEGPLAVELKLHKIDLLQPTHLLALARASELDPILTACARRTDLHIYRLPVAPAARERSAEERRANRQEKYQRYFTGLVRHRFRLNRVAIWGRFPQGSGRDLTELLIGLNDEQGFCLGVGLLQGQTPDAVEVLTPLTTVREVKILRFGSVALDRDGKERFVSAREW